MCRPYNRPRLQQPGEISELIFDTDSDEARLSNDVSSVQGRFESVSGLSQPQPYRQTASSHESSGSISFSASEEEDANNPAMDSLLFPSEQCSTYIQGAPEEKRTMKRPT